MGFLTNIFKEIATFVGNVFWEHDERFFPEDIDANDSQMMTESFNNDDDYEY